MYIYIYVNIYIHPSNSDVQSLAIKKDGLFEESNPLNIHWPCNKTVKTSAPFKFIWMILVILLLYKKKKLFWMVFLLICLAYGMRREARGDCIASELVVSNTRPSVINSYFITKFHSRLGVWFLKKVGWKWNHPKISGIPRVWDSNSMFLKEFQSLLACHLCSSLRGQIEVSNVNLWKWSKSVDLCNFTLCI